MKLISGYKWHEEVAALVWWSRGTRPRGFGLLIPYWRDSAVFVCCFPGRPRHLRLDIRRSYAHGSERLQRQRRQLIERHQARC